MLKLITLFLLIFFSSSGIAQIHMAVKKEGLLLMEGKDSIFFYQKNMKYKDGQYGRCHYIHPLYGADNVRLTEDFPPDHLHQRGVFWAWHQIRIDDKPVADGWELKNFQQNITDIEFQQNDKKGILNTTVEWKSPSWKQGEEVYLRENTIITVHPKTANFRCIDFEISLHALVDGLSIGGSDDEKGYGGFSVRLKLPADVTFTGENGLVEPILTAVDAGSFINIRGSFLKSNKKGGVVISIDPQNPVPDTHWILRKSDSMQNAAYPGRKPVTVKIGEPLILKYTLLVYEENIRSKQVLKDIK